MDTRPLELRDVPFPEPGAGRVARPGSRQRRLPHRPACRRGRAAGSQAAARARPSDRRSGRAGRGGRGGLRARRPRRRAVARGTDGTCPYCRAGWENLCDAPTFTGYQRDGGYAEYAVARADFTLRLPDGYPDVQAAPLLCAGLIGYRALRLAYAEPLEGARAAGALRLRRVRAHRDPGCAPSRPGGLRVHARRGRPGVRARARRKWAGGSDDGPPVSSTARSSSRPWVRSCRSRCRRAQGRCGRLRRHPHEPDPGVPYDLLWGERVVRSVANLTRADGREFLELAARMPCTPRSSSSRSRMRTRRWCG